MDRLAPEPGQITHVRTRHYLVEEVQPNLGNGTLVSLACLDDDAQGQALQVIWELEADAEVLSEEAWRRIGSRGQEPAFDPREWFAAYLHTLRWHCVTATDPTLFQSPFRAGIRLDAYQLEPLRKALLLPQVNLFIADDVGLGKTIEAGLIASELLLRRRVRDVVVACPPSMIAQWQEEMETRFGLLFKVYNREFVQHIRRQQGFGVNPWTTFPRFIISHQLLTDEAYVAPLRDWLGELRPGSLLILDEAHHAAPASGSRYAVDSRITRAIRGLAPHFEHRLFLSATPHNGHSNSFSALLELLDADRFVRGVPVEASSRDEIMVRRLKEDIRSRYGGFPEREVEQVTLDDLPADTPELRLARLLDEYRTVHAKRLADGSKSAQKRAAFMFSGLQQRLLSSVEAFARTLAVHRRSMERIWSAEALEPVAPTPLLDDLLISSPSADRDDVGQAPLDLDDPADLDDAPAATEDATSAEQEQLETLAFEQATLAAAGQRAAAAADQERALLDQLAAIADAARHEPDARVNYLVRWIRDHLLHADGTWGDQRLLIFTEFDHTGSWLLQLLRTELGAFTDVDQRFAYYRGATQPDRRRGIQRAFNAPPAEHPLRILVATDAAREGLNLQAYCADLFHFDLPWNPARLEQRNGRIDRKLQPAPKVFCRYFIYAQRKEDIILAALVRKTKTIRSELGSLSQVLEAELARTLETTGISYADVDRLAATVNSLQPVAPEHEAMVREELESVRLAGDTLAQQIAGLRAQLAKSQSRIGLESAALRQALSAALELLRVDPLAPAPTPADEPARYVFPKLNEHYGADPGWTETLDTLRELPEDGRRDARWRQTKPIRPVVFEAPAGLDDQVVQLHLNHRIVQRLLSRFTAQGFVHDDLSRACLATTADAEPRVILLGRLALYGQGAARLHEELLAVSAICPEPDGRPRSLVPEADSRHALDLLEAALRPGGRELNPILAQRLATALPADLAALRPHLAQRGNEAEDEARRLLTERGRIEAEALGQLLSRQREAVRRRLKAAQKAEEQAAQQPVLPGLEAERRQQRADRAAWERWLEGYDDRRQEAPRRVRDFYKVTVGRLEPVGFVYLWPQTG